MSKPRNVAISEELWVRLKRRALDDRVTLREVVERATHQYLGMRAMSVDERLAHHARVVGDGQRPMTDAELRARALEQAPGMRNAHWVKDDDPA